MKNTPRALGQGRPGPGPGPGPNWGCFSFDFVSIFTAFHVFWEKSSWVFKFEAGFENHSQIKSLGFKMPSGPLIYIYIYIYI